MKTIKALFLSFILLFPAIALAQETPGIPDDPEPATDSEPATKPEAEPEPAPMTEPAPASEAPMTEEVEAPAGEDAEVFPISVGIELGAQFSQVLSDLGTSFTTTVEVAYLLPFIEQRLALFASGSYVGPSHSAEGTDPRLTASSYQYELTEQEVVLAFGPLYRWHPPAHDFNFYGQLGVQLHLQKSEIEGSAGGQPFGLNDETDTKVGLLVGVGGEYHLGPGALALELDFSFSDLDHHITGDASAGGLVLVAGYHGLF